MRIIRSMILDYWVCLNLAGSLSHFDFYIFCSIKKVVWLESVS
jgi:hypothetical protein